MRAYMRNTAATTVVLSDQSHEHHYARSRDMVTSYARGQHQTNVAHRHTAKSEPDAVMSWTVHNGRMVRCLMYEQMCRAHACVLLCHTSTSPACMYATRHTLTI